MGKFQGSGSKEIHYFSGQLIKNQVLLHLVIINTKKHYPFISKSYYRMIQKISYYPITFSPHSNTHPSHQASYPLVFFLLQLLLFLNIETDK